MNVSISKLKGMTAKLEAKLKAKGITDSDQLLLAAKTPAQREELAKLAGVKSNDILELANRADLARIKGIGAAYGDLLENAGVDTVRELANRVPANLHTKLLAYHKEKKMGGPGPGLKAVEDWISQAKALPRMLDY